MENELKCPLCNFWFKKSLLLPCGHSICYQCAVNIVKEVNTLSSADASSSGPDHNNNNNSSSITPTTTNNSSSSGSSAGGSSGSGSGSGSGSSTAVNPTNLGALLIHNPVSSEQDSDHLSETSEADSGVVLNSRTHPSLDSSTGHHALLQHLHSHSHHHNQQQQQHHPQSQSQPQSQQQLHQQQQQIQTQQQQQQNQHPFIYVNNRPCVFSLRCPSCKRLILLDSSGVDCLVQNKALDRVVEKYRKKSGNSEAVKEKAYCQVCSDSSQDESSVLAEWICEQCEIQYCGPCLSRCHPARGALVRHALHSPESGRRLLENRRRQRKASCPCHDGEMLSLFCTHCKMIICAGCVQQFHLQHEIHPIDTICKQQKTELSQLLQSLSEKAKSGMQFVHNLKSLSDKMNKKCSQKEVEILSSIDELINMLHEKKQELISNLHQEKTKKTSEFKEYIHQSTAALGRANGCIQFCIEMLRETDAASFLLISSALVTKVSTIEQTFIQDIEPKVKHGGEFNLQISDLEKLQQMISALRLTEAPIEYYSASIASSEYVTNDAPNPPIFWPEQCIVTNNEFTVFWQPYPGPLVQYYTLEIDDGAAGNFRKVYRGSECVCTVEGLHFDSVYSVRVRAHNQFGDSSYSDVICLQTGKLTVFTMRHKSNPDDVIVSNSGLTISTESPDDRVCLGTCGLSRGVHYWEFHVDRIESGCQPAFGVARSDCKKDEMIGLDEKGWSMYINDKRSWFLHQHEHFERTDGGIQTGSTVGIRLDCDKGHLSYYINDEPHGPIAFTKLVQLTAVGGSSNLNASGCSTVTRDGTLTSSNVTNNNNNNNNNNPNNQQLLPVAPTSSSSSSSSHWSATLSSTNSSSTGTSTASSSVAPSSTSTSNSRFPNLYPAVSINKGIQLTLVVGRDPPSESGESSEDDDTASTAILVPM